MHLPSKPLAASAVLATLLPFTAALSASTAQCVRTSSGYEAACGDKAVLNDCLGSLGEFILQTDIETCFLSARCGPDEAAASAISLLARCASGEGAEQSTLVQELRKRQRRPAATTEDTADETDTADATDDTDDSDATDSETTPARTTAVKTTAAKTTAETTAEATTESNTSVETVVTQPNQPTTAAVSASIIPPESCTTSITVTVNSCSAVDAEGGKTSCERVAVPKATCREGYLCKMDSSGVTTCMEKIDKLSTGGIIVALTFAAAIVVSVALMTFFCYKEKSQQKKLKAKMEAIAIAKASGVGKKRDTSARVPLMAAQGGPPDTGYNGQTAYGDAGVPPPPQGNPFQDPQQRY